MWIKPAKFKKDERQAGLISAKARRTGPSKEACSLQGKGEGIGGEGR